MKLKVQQYWQDLLRTEAASLSSLQYFKPAFYSLSKPHKMWSSVASNPFECSKSLVVAKMISGRYRTELLCRFWSKNRGGFCEAETCHLVPGDLEHLLIHCPALSPIRRKMREFWKFQTINYPKLYSVIQRILTAAPKVQVSFILDPCSFPEIISLGQLCGQTLLNHVLYLTRTFAFYIHKHKMIITGRWPSSQYKSTSHPNTILFSGPTGTDILDQDQDSQLLLTSVELQETNQTINCMYNVPQFAPLQTGGYTFAQISNELLNTSGQANGSNVLSPRGLAVGSQQLESCSSS